MYIWKYRYKDTSHRAALITHCSACFFFVPVFFSVLYFTGLSNLTPSFWAIVGHLVIINTPWQPVSQPASQNKKKKESGDNCQQNGYLLQKCKCNMSLPQDFSPVSGRAVLIINFEAQHVATAATMKPHQGLRVNAGAAARG